MKPYYADDLVTLYHGDCLEVTEWLAADVLVTDPPYGMKYSSNASKWDVWRGDAVSGDGDPALRDEVIRRWGERPALVFGTWKVSRPDRVKQLIVWDEGDSPGMGDLSLPWGPSHEDIYALGSGFIGRRSGSVIRVPGYSSNAADRPRHPTPKPVGLMEKLIAKCPGVIADPFAGSGPTLVAARNLGRRAVGIELEERYCEIIAKRLAQQSFDFGDIA